MINIFANVKKYSQIFAPFSNLLYHLNFLNERSNRETPKTAKLKLHKPCFMNLFFLFMSKNELMSDLLITYLYLRTDKSQKLWTLEQNERS